MDGIVTLVLLAILATFCIRWAAVKLRLPAPMASSVAIVFVLVVLGLWGETLK
ncbi:hypothetical protein EDD29_9043 [Actinocorallia herbida]|uniref:Uncharacterized protein n=1 Tax=Actinocorallia herbida TaxID=58109 RepID=A0A3N1DCP9_9ACTN|nr:hypothetical protein [Actinocorallia herbida]ROO91290.1 hypothetical protein EDD29_9043 [Actinocorallia herbida]